MGLHEMIHHYADAGILLFLRFLSNLLTSEETSRSMPRTSGSIGASSEHDKFSDRHRTEEAAKGADPAKEAFEAFGMSLDEAKSDPVMARERLVKERRRLSRLYHPDRNLDNLEHATEQMKQLNACYEICRKELDDFEGGDQEEKRSERDPSGHESSESDDGGDDFTADNGDGERFCDAMRTEREMKRHQREERRSKMRETKMEDERAEKEYANEIRRQEQAIHVEFHRLYQQRGSPVSSPGSSRPRVINPWQAHMLWVREVAKAQHQGMKSNAPPPPKPKHHTLDGSMHYLAVAIRVGATDMALSHFWHEMILLHVRRLRPHQAQHWLSPSEMHDLSSMAANEFLDSDDNTIFHYASYYENEKLFNDMMVRVGPHFVEALLRPNARGQIPADFCVVCNDEKFKARIDAATAQARRVVRERQLSTKLWNGAKAARGILRRVDPCRVVHHGVAIGFVGPVLFHHGWNISAIPVLLRQSNTSYFVIHLTFSSLRRLVPIWAVLFLALPTWIYVLMALAAVIPNVRERIGRALQRYYHELAQLLSTADELSRTHSLFACIAKKGMTSSQQECLDLLAYSTVWWVASSVAVRSFEHI
jgi:curved DNA-binding protein CbpA